MGPHINTVTKVTHKDYSKTDTTRETVYTDTTDYNEKHKHHEEHNGDNIKGGNKVDQRGTVRNGVSIFTLLDLQETQLNSPYAPQYALLI
uniref:Uncharacterized protein n=1 Tax=Strombidium rassoulzadegani TaxID=1082188 RepID=A0A7S3CS24_9SPIT